MKKTKNISELFALLSFMLVTSALAFDDRGYDPLGLPKDRELPPRPAEKPKPAGPTPFVFKTGILAGERPASDVQNVDTAGLVVFRIQLFTGDLYGEAKRAASVCEEIFDQPVFVDYEVPNFKVRLGSFGMRRDAEKYLEKVKIAGYSNALIVSQAASVRQLPAHNNGQPNEPNDQR